MVRAVILEVVGQDHAVLREKDLLMYQEVAVEAVSPLEDKDVGEGSQFMTVQD